MEFAYAEFALGERARLDELALAAVEARIEADLALGHHGDVAGELEALCQRHPLRERLWELSMLALYRVRSSGRRAAGVRRRPHGAGRRARHRSGSGLEGARGSGAGAGP